MGRLNQKNRDAIVLRYVEKKTFGEIGAALCVTENTAKKRVGYALEQLRRFFAGRGVVSTTAVIAGAISINGIQAAPPALAKSVAAVAITKGATVSDAITKGATVSDSTFALTKGTLKHMAWTKAKTLITGAIVIANMATTTTVVIR